MILNPLKSGSLWHLLIKKVILRDSVFLIVFRTFAKLFLLGFVLIAGGYLSQEEFGDFQFIMSVINLSIQPTIVVTLIITRISCSFPPETLKKNLRWIYQRSRLYLIVTFIFVIALFSLTDSWLSEVANIQTAGLITIAGLIIIAHLIYNYNLGFLLSIESFRAIGLLTFSIGFITLSIVLVVICQGLGILYVLGTYATAIILTLLAMFMVIARKLPKESMSATKNSFPVMKYGILIFLSMAAFFIIFNMDILVIKVLFSRTEVGYYASLELVGKISFLFSSSLAMVIFPKVSKIYERGENPTPYLIKGSLSFFVLSILGMIVILFFSEEFFQIIFGNDFVGDLSILTLILFAKIFQSYIFLLINYEGAVIDRWMVYWISGVLVMQSVMFLLNHDTLHQIATDIVVPSVIGSIVLLLHILIKRKNLAVGHERI